MPVVIDGGEGVADFAVALDPAVSAIAASTNINAAFPATEALNYEPRRTMRSSSTGGTTSFVMDLHDAALGTNPPIPAFTLENMNFGQMRLERSTASGGPWTLVGDYDVSVADEDDGRRKRLIVPGAAVANRYVKWTLSAPDVGGAAYYELGIVVPWRTWMVLNKNFGAPYEKTWISEVETAAYRGGKRDRANESYGSLVIDVVAAAHRSDVVSRTQYAVLKRYPKSRLLCLTEGGDDTKMYHVYRAADSRPRVTRTADALLRLTGLQYEEVE